MARPGRREREEYEELKRRKKRQLERQKNHARMRDYNPYEIEYGMDDYALIKELIRLTDELKNTEFYERKSLVEALLQFAQELEEKETNVENGT